MAYVPIPSQPQPPASPRARELSQKIRATIEEFERHYPGTEPADVRRALELASGETNRTRMTVSLTVGLVVAGLIGLLVAFFFAAA